jgi:hypothetical protein
MIFLLLAAASLAPATADCRMIAFSRSPALARSKQEICIERGGVGGQFAIRRSSTDRSGGVSVTYTNTSDCPGVLPLLKELEQLELPRPDFPGFGKEPEFITLDGAGYSLTAPALYDGAMSKLVVQSNVSTPLAQWIDRTLKALDPC